MNYIMVENNTGSLAAMHMKEVGKFDNGTSQRRHHSSAALLLALVLNKEQQILWPGNTSTTPLDMHKTLQIGVLLPMTAAACAGFDQTNVSGVLPLAVDAVKQDSELLPGYSLSYSWEESQCTPEEDLKSFGRLKAADGNGLAGLIGPEYSESCVLTAYLAEGENTVQISPSCESGLLSDKTVYPNFARTTASLTSQGPAMVSLMRYFKWHKPAMLYATQSLWVTSADSWRDAMKSAEPTITCRNLFGLTISQEPI